jgi:hypothetical protein
VTTTGTASNFKFDAFLSYAQSDAADAAAAIEDGLEKLARPWNRRRALNIYRDRSSQTATADLSGSLRRSLMQSRRLVVLASPGAAASPWVAEEVRHWRSARSSEDVLIVLVAGELHWSPTETDFDWTATTSVPSAFAGAFSSEPKYVDLRPLEAARLTLHDPAFRDAVAELSGSLTGRDKDELVGEDLRQFKKGRRIRRIGVTLLAVLTVASLVAGAVAVVQRRRAEARASQLLAERLADTTVSLAPTRPLDGIAAALVSLEIRETPAGHRALVNALTTAETMPEALGSHAQPVRLIEFSPDGELLLSATGQWMQLRDPKTGELVAEREVIDEASAGDLAYRCAVAGAAFTSRGDQIVTVDQCGRLVTWGVPDLNKLNEWIAPVSSGELVRGGALATSPDLGEVALVVGASIVILDVENLTVIRWLGSPLPPGEAPTALAALADDLFLVGGSTGSLAVLTLDGRAARLESPHRTSIVRVRRSPEGAGLFAVIDGSHAATFWRLRDGGDGLVTAQFDLGDHGFGVADAVFGGGDSTLWTLSTTGDLAEWILNDDEPELRAEDALPSVDEFEVGEIGMAVHPRERLIVSAAVEGVLYRWRLGEAPALRRPIETGTFAEHVDLLADGKTIVVAGRGEVWLGELEGNRTSGAVAWNAPPGEEISDVALAPDGRLLAVATVSGVHVLGRGDDGSWERRWTWAAPDVYGIQFAGDNQIAAATREGLLVLLGAQRGERRLERKLVEPALVDFSLDPAGRVAMGVTAGGCTDPGRGCGAIVPMTDDATGPRRVDAYPVGVVLGDARRAGFTDGGSVHIVGMGEPGDPEFAISVALNPVDLVSSADGRVVLVSAEAPRAAESLVKLIDAATGEPMGEDLRFDTRLADADLSPDAQYVAVVSDGNTAVYEVDAFFLDRVRTRACAVLGRNAFSFEWGQLTGGRPYRRICPDAPLNSFDLD